MRVMITGGGTGGHTSPAVAILEELRRRDPQLLVQWVGKKGAIEERVSAAQGVPFRDVPAEGWPRQSSVRRALVAVKMAAGLARAATYLRKFRPHAVIGVGGYVSLPLMWAAQRFGTPTVLHEQNKRLGMANRLLAPKASLVFLSFEDTLGDYPRDRARVVGNPVRAGFVSPPEREDALRKLGLKPSIPVVLIVGGSQGAQSINRAVAEALPGFGPEDAQFLWMTGADGVAAARTAAEQMKARVEVFPFIEDIVTACAAADLMIARSGASTTAELAMLGKPSILIPYPHATDNHQEANARAFEAAGAAEVMLDSECDGARLGAALRGLLADPARLAAMSEAARGLARPGAAEAIVDAVFELVFQ